ncbi:MAG: hypothetical protein ACR2O1_13435 [Boseongicola sp.]
MDQPPYRLADALNWLVQRAPERHLIRQFRQLLLASCKYAFYRRQNEGFEESLMSILEDIAHGLAKRALEVIERTGDDTIEKRVGDEIGSSSPTLQENFATAVRIRKAEVRAMKLIEKFDKGEDIPVAQISSQPQDMDH